MSGGPWVISIPQPPSLMVEAVVDHMKAKGIKTVAYIGFSDSWGDLVYNSLMAAAKRDGIKVVTNERYARPDTSVTGQVLKIIAAHPDAVMDGGSGTPGALPLLALAERGYTGPVYGSHALINADFIRVGGAGGRRHHLPDRARWSWQSSFRIRRRPRRRRWRFVPPIKRPTA